MIDLAAEVRAALASRDVGEALANMLRPIIADAVRAELERQAESQLLPLSKILGISARAALGRLSKDAELRSLGHRLGRSLVFRAHEVQALLAARQREKAGG